MNNPAKGQELRPHSPDAEQALWNRLRTRQLAGYTFRRQGSLGQSLVAFVCLTRTVGIVGDDAPIRSESRPPLFAPRGWSRKAAVSYGSGIPKSWLPRRLYGRPFLWPYRRIHFLLAHPHPSPLPSRERGRRGKGRSGGVESQPSRVPPRRFRLYLPFAPLYQGGERKSGNGQRMTEHIRG